MAFAILNEGRDVARPRSHYTVGIMDMSEDYDSLQYNFRDLLCEVNAMEGTQFVDPLDAGKSYTIRMFLSGDWKFLRIITGMAAPNQMYFCLWCPCTKEEIADLSRTWKITRTEDRRQHMLNQRRANAAAMDTEVVQEVPIDAKKRHAYIEELLNKTPLPILKKLSKAYMTGHKKDLKKTTVTGLLGRMTSWSREDVITACNGLREKLALHDAAKLKNDATEGYVRPNLLASIPFERIMCDVLHTFLRIFDVTFSLLAEDGCRVGKIALERIAVEVRDHCGVGRFKFKYGDPEGDEVRRQADPEALPSSIITFTDLDGKEKLRIVRNLRLDRCFHEEEGVDVVVRQEIWSQFNVIYDHLSSWMCEISPSEFRDLCTQWMETFLTQANEQSGHSIDGLHQIPLANGQSLYYRGYYAKDVTPYIHCLVHHIWEMQSNWGGSIMCFACFALERANGQHSKSYFASNNHGGGRRAASQCPTEQRHIRKVAAYRQMLERLIRLAFNRCEKEPKFVCTGCSNEYNAEGWVANHWISKHKKAWATTNKKDQDAVLTRGEVMTLAVRK
jgi:hypothetical protein